MGSEKKKNPNNNDDNDNKQTRRTRNVRIPRKVDEGGRQKKKSKKNPTRVGGPPARVHDIRAASCAAYALQRRVMCVIVRRRRR